MHIVDFTHAHIPEAAALAVANYEEERRLVSVLPHITAVPDLTPFADNGLGVAAFNGGILVGFMGFYSPFDNAFTTYAKGTFSPIHGHGAIAADRENIYKRLYQAAADKLVKVGVSSHAIALYAHDAAAQNAFFTCGFGLRCIDAVREMESIPQALPCPCVSRELSKSEAILVRQLRHLLSAHLAESPCFMYQSSDTVEAWLTRAENRNSRLFAMQSGDKVIAFIEVMDDGENFATEAPDMKNICGAFCLPEYRGKGIMQNLLNFTISTLKAEGYTHLGVDFESFNPTAYGFWLKHFTAYTHSVVRRIDERILENS